MLDLFVFAVNALVGWSVAGWLIYRLVLKRVPTQPPSFRFEWRHR